MHSHNNGFKTALLMGSMVGMMLLIGGLLSVSFRSSIFIWIMGLFGLASVAYTYWNSDKLALRSMDAYPVSREEVPVLYDIVEELSSRAGQPMPALYVAPTMTPNAFATGRTRRMRRCAAPRVFCSCWMSARCAACSATS